MYLHSLYRICEDSTITCSAHSAIHIQGVVCQSTFIPVVMINSIDIAKKLYY